LSRVIPPLDFRVVVPRTYAVTVAIEVVRVARVLLQNALCLFVGFEAGAVQGTICINTGHFEGDQVCIDPLCGHSERGAHGGRYAPIPWLYQPDWDREGKTNTKNLSGDLL
jgi:hypothetical protein